MREWVPQNDRFCGTQQMNEDHISVTIIKVLRMKGTKRCSDTVWFFDKRISAFQTVVDFLFKKMTMTGFAVIGVAKLYKGLLTA